MNSQHQLQGFQLYLLLTAIALAAFLISLDGFIVNVAIPTISGELGVREDAGTWIITLFSIASTACVPLSNSLSMRFGKFALFIPSMLFFAFASFLAGSAQNFTILLIARVLQGMAAGLLTPVSLTLIIDNFPPEKRSVAIGFWSFFVMVGPAMGPMIGGFLSDYRWPWMFYLNIPISIFSAFTVWVYLRDKKENIERCPLDTIGVLLLFIAVGGYQSAMNRWNIDDWFHSSFIVFLFVLATLSLIFFIVWEYFHPHPYIHIELFKKRNFALPSLVTGLGMGLLFSSFVLDSLWVQEVLGYTPAWAGLTLSPVGIFPLIFYPIVGRIVLKLDLRIWVIMSFLLYAATFLWLSKITVYTPFWHLALPRLVQGIGFAIFTVPNAVLVVQGVEEKKLTSIISLFSFTRMLFVGFGVALAITLWFFRQAFYQTRLKSRVFFFNPLLEQLTSAFDQVTQSDLQSIALTNNTIAAEASTLALADIYYLYAWLFIALCFIVLFFKPAKRHA